MLNRGPGINFATSRGSNPHIAECRSVGFKPGALSMWPEEEEEAEAEAEEEVSGKEH